MDLSPQEQRIVDYHRSTIQSKKVGTDKQGKPVTVYSTGIQIMDGPNKGKFVAVPGFVDIEGKRQIVNNEDRLREYWRREIDAGEWPMYNSGAELNKRSKEIHSIMDTEEVAAREARKNLAAEMLSAQPNQGTEALK